MERWKRHEGEKEHKGDERGIEKIEQEATGMETRGANGKIEIARGRKRD